MIGFEISGREMRRRLNVALAWLVTIAVFGFLAALTVGMAGPWMVRPNETAPDVRCVQGRF
ncbi:MAG: hypothetical protein RI936_23 [Pseudomonadota bacterium]|jgi:hypothetical protein